MSNPTCEFERPDGDTLAVRLGGSWKLDTRLPEPDRVLAEARSDVRRIVFDGRAVADWDTGLLNFLIQVIQRSEAQEIETDRSELPEGVRRLLDLATAVPEKETRRGEAKLGPLARIGEQAIAGWNGTLDMFTFLGEATFSFGRLIVGRARFRRSDLSLAIQEAGVEALGIVSLISFLVGLILAFRVRYRDNLQHVAGAVAQLAQSVAVPYPSPIQEEDS